MAFQLRCPKCRKAFPWKPTDAMPTDCPLCWESIGEERPNDEIVMPFIRSAKTDRTDKLYRDMERGSEFRAEAAAAQAGVPVSEMSSLKMTNMMDNQREGDIAAPPISNPVSQMIDANPGIVGFQGSNGSEYSGSVQTGPHPNMGARMRTMIQQNHPQMVQQHAVGYDPVLKRAVIPSGDVISDSPARETQQPGYRRRG